MAKREHHYPIGSAGDWQEEAEYRRYESHQVKMFGLGAVACSGAFGVIAVESLVADKPLWGLASITMATGTAFFAKGRFEDAQRGEKTAAHYHNLAVQVSEEENLAQ